MDSLDLSARKRRRREAGGSGRQRRLGSGDIAAFIKGIARDLAVTPAELLQANDLASRSDGQLSFVSALSLVRKKKPAGKDK